MKKDGAGGLLNLRLDLKKEVKNMTFEYQSKIYLGEVALYVADLARQKNFYQRVLGGCVFLILDRF